MAVVLTNSCLRVSDYESENESSSASSSMVAPVARRSKFDDEEDDSDVCHPQISHSNSSHAYSFRSSILGMLPRIRR